MILMRFLILCLFSCIFANKKKIHIYNIIIIKLEALLMLKILQYVFGQIVFEWFMVKNPVPLTICHFYVKITLAELLATALSL